MFEVVTKLEHFKKNIPDTEERNTQEQSKAASKLSQERLKWIDEGLLHHGHGVAGECHKKSKLSRVVRREFHLLK